MGKERVYALRSASLGLLAGAAGFMILVAVAQAYFQRAPQSAHHVHIAFGFHVNLYHSFRNDSPDESGFGQDIRVIRHIIATLDRLNAEGIPVKVVWNFDNLFSLQELLPRYAPDIIDAIRRRVDENGDEVILMSFNNGMVSAMTLEELKDAMRWAVSNPWNSGVADLFGTYSPIVRPQEMMTTPGNFAVYRELGIQAAALYYSATPFDAFRVFTRPLAPAEAHNPLLYQNPRTGEQMVIIPAYHIGDLVENVSLGHWVKRLRRMQDRRKLDHDALIFINYDADSQLWQGIGLPRPLRWLPNAGGIEGWIREISHLDFVRFTTLGDYLANRPPVGTISFAQDTADGSFNGYSSWAEKSDATRYWTIIERNRRISAAARSAQLQYKDIDGWDALLLMIEQSEALRMRALSTTHFGMATPFLAPQRQTVADALMAELDAISNAISLQLEAELGNRLAGQAPPATDNSPLEWVDTIMVVAANPTETVAGHRFIHIEAPVDGIAQKRFFLARPEGTVVQAIPLFPQVSLAEKALLAFYIPDPKGVTEGIYHLLSTVLPAAQQSDNGKGIAVGGHFIGNGALEVRWDDEGRLEGIYLNDQRRADAGSLGPYLMHDGRRMDPSELRIRRHAAADGRLAAVRITGTWQAPPGAGLSDGWMDYRLTVVADRPYLLLDGRIQYPTTAAHDILKPGIAALSRPADMRWGDVAPAEIRFSPQATRSDPVVVLKHNYLGVTSGYPLDYFRHDHRNRHLDNVNNHITAAYVGVVAGGRGMAIAMDTSVQANFAFAPLRMRHDPSSDAFSVKINPFGTYHGRQYRPPTRGNGHGFEATLLAGEQFASSGPTYNGVSQHFVLLIAFFDGRQIPDDIQQDLLTFAHPPLVISLRSPVKTECWSKGPAPLPTSACTAHPPNAPQADFARHLANQTADGGQHSDMPLLLGLRVVWANVRALLSGLRIDALTNF